MAQPTREEAVAVLRQGHAAVDGLLARLSPEDLVRPATIGRGDWSAPDLLGHLGTWEELAVRSLEEFRAGRTPWVEGPDGPFSAPATGKVDAFNAESVERKRRQPWETVRREADSVHQTLIRAIEQMSDQEWGSPALYQTSNRRRRRLSTLLGSILAAPHRPFGHAFAHVPDLEAYVRTTGTSS